MGNWDNNGGVIMGPGICRDHVIILTPTGDTLARLVGGQMPKSGTDVTGDFHHLGTVAISLPNGGTSILQMVAVDLGDGQLNPTIIRACGFLSNRRR